MNKFYQSVLEIFLNKVLSIITTVKWHAIHTISIFFFFFKKKISFASAPSSHSGLIPLYKKKNNNNNKRGIAPGDRELEEFY